MQQDSPFRFQGVRIAADILKDHLKIFLKKTALGMVCLLIPLVLWKALSTDWVVTIPKTSGGVVRYYPSNSPIWVTPKPTPPFTNFSGEYAANYGSGAGPSLRQGAEKIDPDWIITFGKITAGMIIFFVIFSIREISRLVFQPPKSKL